MMMKEKKQPKVEIAWWPIMTYLKSVVKLGKNG